MIRRQKIRLIEIIENDGLFLRFRPTKWRACKEAIQMRIGQNIRYYRKKMGMTQEELGGAANLSHAYLSKIENEKCQVGREGLERIAAAMNIPMAYLVEEPGEQLPNHTVEKILEELADCNRYEEEVIEDTITELKHSLRRHRQE